jgi:cell division topological specificity factor
MSFLDRVGLSRRRSADSAKERLQLVLIHDRSGLSPGKLETLKDEIIDTISRHVEIDTAGVEINLTKEREQQRLVADIPLIPINRRRR